MYARRSGGRDVLDDWMCGGGGCNVFYAGCVCVHALEPDFETGG